MISPNYFLSSAQFILNYELSTAKMGNFYRNKGKVNEGPQI